jgi:integrase
MNRKRKKENRKKKGKKFYGELERRGECLYRNSLSGVYYFQGQINKTRRTQSLGTTDYATARRELVKRRALLGDETYLSTVKISLADWCERYRRTFQRAKPATVADKERALKRIVEDWPTGRNTPLDLIRRSDCDLWLAQYKFGIPSRNGYRWLLRDLFQKAVQDGLLRESPAEHLKSEKRKTPLRLTPTFEEFKKIVVNVRSQRFNGHDAKASGDFLEAEGSLGLGQAELATMTRQDVDLERQQISVHRRKTGERFVIPVYPQARALIERLCAGKRHNQRLFAIGNAKRALKNACDRLDFPPFSQRSLRRMFVTRAIEKGIDVKVIASWQGHRDGGLLILKTYSWVQQPHAERMAQLMV